MNWSFFSQQFCSQKLSLFTEMPSLCLMFEWISLKKFQNILFHNNFQEDGCFPRFYSSHCLPPYGHCWCFLTFYKYVGGPLKANKKVLKHFDFRPCFLYNERALPVPPPPPVIIVCQTHPGPDRVKQNMNLQCNSQNNFKRIANS
jgi:hypothetical protein